MVIYDICDSIKTAKLPIETNFLLINPDYKLRVFIMQNDAESTKILCLLRWINLFEA